MSIDIRPLEDVRQAWALRRDVLRPGMPLSSIDFAEDALPGATHLGAFSPAGELIGVASLYRQSLGEVPGLEPGLRPTADWRLRGMAVDPAWQGKGVGSQLLAACQRFLTTQGARGLWCNGRTTASPFYLRHGFTTLGKEFVLPDSGAHYVMFKR